MLSNWMHEPDLGQTSKRVWALRVIVSHITNYYNSFRPPGSGGTGAPVNALQQALRTPLRSQCHLSSSFVVSHGRAFSAQSPRAYVPRAAV